MKNLLLASIFVLSTAAFATEPATPPAGEQPAANTAGTNPEVPTTKKVEKPVKHQQHAGKKKGTAKKESM